MLLQLPLEILLIIARHLDSEDKLNLKLTCLKLNDLITKEVLYEYLDLEDSRYWKEQYSSCTHHIDRIFQKLIDNKFDGSLVKVLRFNTNYLSGPFYSKLSDLFPSVTRFIDAYKPVYIISFDYYDVEKVSKKAEIPLAKWRNTINKIVSKYDWNELKMDLFCSKYPRLTVLDIEPTRLLIRDLFKNGSIPLFKNAPFLTSFTLTGTLINLTILEAIHTGFPLLKSLAIKESLLLDENDMTLHRPIVPTNTVLYLEFNKINGSDIAHGALKEYILKKYTKLEQLILGLFLRDDCDAIVRKNLEHLDPFYETDIYLDETPLFPKSFFGYYTLGSTFFFSLPKSIKKLTLCSSEIDDMLAGLAESNSKITMLDLAGVHKDYIITKENIFKHLKKLTALKTLRISLFSYVRDVTIDFISHSITRLSLYVVGDHFYIDWILSMFPSLSELFISWPGEHLNCCEIRGKHGNGTNNEDIKEAPSRKEYPNLRTLTIRRHLIHPNFYDYIKTAAPNLDEFDLEIFFTGGPRTKATREKLDLSNWHLSKCYISLSAWGCEAVFHSIVTIKNVSEHYVFDTRTEIIEKNDELLKMELVKDKLLESALLGSELRLDELLQDEYLERLLAQSLDVEYWVEIIADHIKHLKISGPQKKEDDLE